jgi:hypothetical protein
MDPILIVEGHDEPDAHSTRAVNELKVDWASGCRDSTRVRQEPGPKMALLVGAKGEGGTARHVGLTTRIQAGIRR